MANILIVDDDKEVVKVFSGILSRAGYSVIGATNGQDAITLARGKRPDMILLDISMPGMDGGQVAHVLLSLDQTKDIPIVFLTSIISEREVVESGGVIGGRSFLSKYSEPEEIVRLIKQKLPAEK